MSKSFLQSAEWARFQESVGRKVFWLEKKLVIKHDLPLGLAYFYCPRPEFKDGEEFKKFVHEIKKLAKAEKAVFIKVEPNKKLIIDNSKSDNFPLGADQRIAEKFKIKNLKLELAKNLQPHDSLILELNQSESAILAEMHPKTRYNIRLAEKHGVKIIKSTNVKDIDDFYQLAVKTSQRDKFSYHSKEYYQKMMEVLKKDKMVELLIAEIPKSKAQISNKIQSSNTKYDIHDTKYIPIASILVLFYKDSAIYLHGASDHGYRKFMAPYLLQWQAIREAKKRGCNTYDFWGIAPFEENPKSKIQTSNQIQNQNDSGVKNSLKISNFKFQINEGHPWAGITRFKLGFAPNGQVLHYPQAFDLIFKPSWYRIYRLVKG